jgi:hypothetical protein
MICGRFVIISEPFINKGKLIEIWKDTVCIGIYYTLFALVHACRDWHACAFTQRSPNFLDSQKEKKFQMLFASFDRFIAESSSPKRATH